MTDPDEPVVLTQVQTGFEAETIVKALEAHGIIARSADTATNATWGGVAGSFALAKVLVRAEDLERAKNALRAIKAESIDIDWDELDVGDEEPPGARRAGWARWVYLIIGMMIALGALAVTTGARQDAPVLTTCGVVLILGAGVIAVVRVWLSSDYEGDEPAGDQDAEPPQSPAP